MKEKATRKSLINKRTGFSQTRNAVYWLQRLMKKQGYSEQKIKERLKEMGKNIGGTLSQEYEAEGSDLPLRIEKLYKEILNSKITLIKKGDLLIIEDQKCPLCKYQYEDITIPGCTLIPEMVKEFFAHKGITIEEAYVEKSVTLGDSLCRHIYSLS